ncbi:MAG: hypothetical protein GX595_13575, partial [Lentisphaerae bacterium]|nr:hypothetical protein [Lentisphaerota bacterium]
QSAACAAAQAAVAAAAAAVGRCRDEVRRLGGMDSRLRCRHTADLVRRHEELERTASRREEILRSIESIETRVREAKARHDLEGRLAEYDEARAALEAQRGSGWQALAGQVSVETLTATLEDHASGVLQRAQESFAAITRGRYRLLAEAADGGAVLRARDGESGRLHDLDELSSGTRLQLLLAARLAFLAEREGEGPMLPLILDEVLGNSDDERAGTIMDIVIAAARQGRQVICFTAQSDELGKWQGRLQAAGVPWARHWLPAGVAAPPAVPVAAPAWAPEPVPVPRPGEGAADYAKRLRVPPLDPFETLPGSIHLAWIVDDPGQLHALLAAGYRTWGALSLLLSLESGAAALRAGAPALTDLDRDRLTARAEMLQHLLALLRQGRRRRVSRAELRASGTVSARFLPEVEALLEASGGDGRELLRRLGEGAVRGFRRRQFDALEAWLDEHGCRDDRPTLSLDGLRAHLHARAAGYLVDGRLRLADVDNLVAQAAGCLAGLEADAPRGTE